MDHWPSITKAAVESHSDPTKWQWTTWAMAVGMAFAGGLVSLYEKGKRGGVKVFEVAMELFSSGFVGLGCYMLLDAYGFAPGVCAAAAGVGGHMGTRLLFRAERMIRRDNGTK